jgi:hypothetical protein
MPFTGPRGSRAGCFEQARTKTGHDRYVRLALLENLILLIPHFSPFGISRGVFLQGLECPNATRLASSEKSTIYNCASLEKSHWECGFSQHIITITCFNILDFKYLGCGESRWKRTLVWNWKEEIESVYEHCLLDIFVSPRPSLSAHCAETNSSSNALKRLVPSSA